MSNGQAIYTQYRLLCHINACQFELYSNLTNVMFVKYTVCGIMHVILYLLKLKLTVIVIAVQEKMTWLSVVS